MNTEWHIIVNDHFQDMYCSYREYKICSRKLWL